MSNEILRDDRGVLQRQERGPIHRLTKMTDNNVTKTIYSRWIGGKSDGKTGYCTCCRFQIFCGPVRSATLTVNIFGMKV